MDKTDNKTETKLDKSNRNKERLPFTERYPEVAP